MSCCWNSFLMWILDLLLLLPGVLVSIHITDRGDGYILGCVSIICIYILCNNKIAIDKPFALKIALFSPSVCAHNYTATLNGINLFF